MKFFCTLIILSIAIQATVVAQRPFIHAHNDYEKPAPLLHALQNKAFSIEADVFLINDTLRVAHAAAAATTAPTLIALYLQPIIALFEQQHGTISSDTAYSPILMIDIKKNGEAALAVLQDFLAIYPKVFNRKVNAKAVQIVISGDIGPIDNWKNYPSTILFDGRPTENYDSLTWQKIGFVSDAYTKYSNSENNMEKRIQELANDVHKNGKLLRLWATPDYPASWYKLLKLGVDIINTDFIAECRKQLSK